MTAETTKTAKLTRRQALALAGGALVASSAAAQAASTGSASGASNQAKLTQVRNATLRIDYGSVRFLVDPMLGGPGSFPAFPRTPNQDRTNPMVPLPVDVAGLVDVDAVILTHLHHDHWDAAAKAALSKSLPVFVQDEADAQAVRGDGFKDVRVLTPTTEFKGVTLARTRGVHGSPAVIEKMGKNIGLVCGVAFKRQRLKTIYVAGDTVWNDDVADAIRTHRPDVIVLNCGDAYVFGVGSLIMGTQDVLAVHKAAPQALLIGSHMEAVNHCVLTRGALQAFADREGFLDKIKLPKDGETVTL
ncbi:MBL fold metallo-hydrolase [Microvirga arabica]|uniref:MBL fold metallo-hydrolase n=1 Tax=Microvirga arabica TaxID=1128671 RepID=A0ABV6YBT8_9HYPH